MPKGYDYINLENNKERCHTHHIHIGIGYILIQLQGINYQIYTFSRTFHSRVWHVIITRYLVITQ